MPSAPRGLPWLCPLHQVPTNRPDPVSLFRPCLVPCPRPLLLCLLLRLARGVPSVQTLLFLWSLGEPTRLLVPMELDSRPPGGHRGSPRVAFLTSPCGHQGKVGDWKEEQSPPVSKHFAESPSGRRGHNLSVEGEIGKHWFSGSTFSTR